jgi:NADPH:quinone reductase-like Zn-dependent oxidoreductase
MTGLLSRLVGQRLRMLASQPRQQDLQVLQELIDAGKVTAVIDKTFPLSQVPQAIRYLVEGHGGGGKIVITV